LREKRQESLNKKIWYISKYASPLKYGFGSRHFYIGRELNRLGFQTAVIASNSNHLAHIPDFESVYTREVIDGVDTVWIRTIRYRGAASVRRVLSWIEFEIKLFLMPRKMLFRPDTVIVSSLSLLTILNGIWLKARLGCRLIFEIRDIWPLTITEEGGFSEKNPLVMLLALVEKLGYRRSDVVVGTMPNLSEHADAVAGRKLNCQCIPFGYDPELYRNPVPLDPGYEEAHIPANKFIVGYAGSIGRTNALDTLIDCAIEMADDPRIHFLLLGGGDLLDEYKRKVKGYPNVSFAPKVKKEQVQNVLRHCDVLYLSVEDSKVWRYGQSLNKLIDYMLAAKPIIASYGGYPSMINEADCGTFLPSKNVPALVQAVKRYAEMPKSELERIGARGKAWFMENRPYSKVARDYARLL
jgi:glycosyltransferase involved in cell wall biosynthesis